MKLTLAYINDVHGYIKPHKELFYNGTVEKVDTAGGYARISELIKQIRNNNPDTLLFDGGDTFHGTLPVVESKGECLIPILNQLGFTAMVGHWDFGYGPAQLKKIISRLNYPFLGINVYRKNGTLFSIPFILKNIGNIKIGIIGICSNIIDKTMPESFSRGLKITDGSKELPVYIKKLKKAGANIIILLSHNGFPQDVYLMEKISGVDICLSAHTHNRLYDPVLINKTIIIQCGCHGSFIGKLELNIKQNTILSHKYELIKVNKNIRQDKIIKKKADEIEHPYKQLQKNVLAETPIILHRYNTLNSSMDNLFLAAIKYITKTQIAFSNGWRYGVPIDKGIITEWDLYNIVPMNPLISTTDMSGEEIINMLEENLERTFSKFPLQQMGGYVKRCYGIKVNIRIENPKQHRIQEIYFGGVKLIKDKSYKISFITSQGVPKKYGKNRQQLTITAVNAMIKFLLKNPGFNFRDYEVFSLV